MLPLKLRLALLSAGYVRLVWPENRMIVLVWQCFGDHCTANMLVVQCVLTLCIYSTYLSCQYLFEGIDILGYVCDLGLIH